MWSDLYQNTEEEESGEKIRVKASRFTWTYREIIFEKAILGNNGHSELLIDSILVWKRTVRKFIIREKSNISIGIDAAKDGLRVELSKILLIRIAPPCGLLSLTPWEEGLCDRKKKFLELSKKTLYIINRNGQSLLPVMSSFYKSL